MSTKITLSQVNAMSPQEFAAVFGRVFEHSPWIAERAFVHKPFVDAKQLHAAMVAVVRGATHHEQLALLRAHPELAGREAQTDTLTPESTNEQQGAGLNALTKDEMARISAWNKAHAERFGFPFIIAVRMNNKASIFSEFERRLTLSPGDEQAACLEQVYLITQIRIGDLIDA